MSLAFLHTAPSQVAFFEAVTRSIDPSISARHDVREDLLAAVVASGVISEATRTGLAENIQTLAADGARIVVCTCSTLGTIAEATPVPAPATVMRIDRPMVEQAVTLGARILVVAALETTLPSTLALVHECARAANRTVTTTIARCPDAWPLFQAGDRTGYVAAIADSVRAQATNADVVVLAQASMAPAAELLSNLGVPVLSSPVIGVRAAISRLAHPMT